MQEAFRTIRLVVASMSYAIGRLKVKADIAIKAPHVRKRPKADMVAVLTIVRQNGRMSYPEREVSCARDSGNYDKEIELRRNSDESDYG